MLYNGRRETPDAMAADPPPARLTLISESDRMSTRDLHEDDPELSPPRRAQARDARPSLPAARRAASESASLDHSPVRIGRYIALFS